MPDRDSFISQLFEQQHKRLTRTAYRLTGSMELAEDLVQDTFLFAFIRYKDLTDHPCINGWLSKTLKNLVLNENRRLENHPEIPLEYINDHPAPELPVSLDEILPLHIPAEDRQVLIWRYEQQLSYRDIAMRLGISENTCRMRVHRILKKYKLSFERLQPQ